MIRQHLSNLVEHVLDTQQLRRATQQPSQVHLSVTDRCFLPCKHCDIWKNESVDLPTEVWLKLINELGPWCAPAGLNFVGGEPLLRSDLPELINAAKKHGFEVSFNTNAWLLNPQKAQAICDAGADIVYISMDGFKPQTIDYSRGREGSHQKLIEAIEMFQALPNPRVVIASILHAQNASEILELLHWVTVQGLQLVIQPLYQNFGNVVYDPDWWKESEFWPHSEAQREEVCAVLDALTTARLRGQPVCNAAPQLQAMKFHFLHPSADSGLSCRAGHQDISIDPHGNVRLCYFLDPVGSIFDERPLSELWQSRHTLRRRWEVSRCERHCNLLNCNFDEGN
ncbi:MAG: radical SAM/SPASM domain-containing protein [Myxococcota bacterium]